MNRFLSLLIVFSLLFSLIGCGSRREDLVAFYYCRDPEEYQYFEEDGVICSESRDLIGHNENIRYVIGLYLAGPMEEGLRSPMPPSVKLVSAERTLDAVQLTFSDLDDVMSESEFSLACACLTLTCADLTGCHQVTVISGSRTVTMTTDSIRLLDNGPIPETTKGD